MCGLSNHYVPEPYTHLAGTLLLIPGVLRVLNTTSTRPVVLAADRYRSSTSAGSCFRVHRQLRRAKKAPINRVRGVVGVARTAVVGMAVGDSDLAAMLQLKREAAHDKPRRVPEVESQIRDPIVSSKGRRGSSRLAARSELPTSCIGGLQLRDNLEACMIALEAPISPVSGQLLHRFPSYLPQFGLLWDGGDKTDHDRPSEKLRGRREAHPVALLAPRQDQSCVASRRAY